MSGSALKAPQKPRVIVGISGASGFSYGVQALRYLRQLDVETHLVISPAGHLNREHETTLTETDVAELADVVYPFRAVGAAIASGSFRTLGMLVAPCSMHTLAAISTGLTDNLLTRAADVVLKERRRLVLMVRETPLHAGHLRNMQQVTESGAIVFRRCLPCTLGRQLLKKLLRIAWRARWVCWIWTVPICLAGVKT